MDIFNEYFDGYSSFERRYKNDFFKQLHEYLIENRNYAIGGEYLHRLESEDNKYRLMALINSNASNAFRLINLKDDKEEWIEIKTLEKFKEIVSKYKLILKSDLTEV
jgi:hypothetical protein